MVGYRRKDGITRIKCTGTESRIVVLVQVYLCKDQNSGT